MPDAQLLQFGGSLLAILALAWLVSRLGLGQGRRIADEAEAVFLAQEAVDGFEPIATAIDADGRGALLRSKTGALMLLKVHGAHVAARLLTRAARADASEGAITVHSGERRFGAATLTIDDPGHWAEAIRAL